MKKLEYCKDGHVRSIFTARKRSLGQGNIFTSMCHSFCPRGGGEVGRWLPSMHWEEGFASQHALWRCWLATMHWEEGWLPSMHWEEGVGFPACTGKGVGFPVYTRRGVASQHALGRRCWLPGMHWEGGWLPSMHWEGVGFPVCTVGGLASQHALWWGELASRHALGRRCWLPGMHWEGGLASQHALGRGLASQYVLGWELASQHALWWGGGKFASRHALGRRCWLPDMHWEVGGWLPSMHWERGFFPACTGKRGWLPSMH